MTWIANVLFLIGVLLIGRKKKSGWVVEFVGELLWITRSLESKQWDLLFVCLMFGSLQLWNFWLWRKEELNSDRKRMRSLDYLLEKYGYCKKRGI